MESTRALFRAIASDDTDAVVKLIQAKAEVTALGEWTFHSNAGSYFTSALHIAAKHNRLKMIALLSEARGDVNLQVHDCTPLSLAASGGHVEAVKLLVSLKAAVEPDTFMPPLHVAATGGHLECVKALIDARADPQTRAANGHSVLIAAAEAPNASVMRFFCVETNVCGDQALRTTDNSGRTLLHVAASFARHRTVSLLLELKSSVNAKQPGGLYRTPLLEACSAWFGSDEEKSECVEALIAAGADPEATDHEDACALLQAASVGSASVLRLLLARSIGGGVNQRNRDGDTPLMAACRFCHAEAARVLLENGADINARTQVRFSLFVAVPHFEFVLLR